MPLLKENSKGNSSSSSIGNCIRPASPSVAGAWTRFTSLLSTIILFLNLYLAGLLLRPFQGAIFPLQLLNAGQVLPSQSQPPSPSDHLVDNFGDLRRAGLLVDSPFRTAGIFLHSIIVTGAYRTGPAGWAVLGLGPLQLYRNKAACNIQCVWLDAATGSGSGIGAVVSQSVKWDTPGSKYRPGSYLTLAVDCVFPRPVGDTGGGGALLLRVTAIPVADAGAHPDGDFGRLNVSSSRPMGGWSGPADDDAWMADQLRPLYSEFQRQSDASPVQVVAATERPQQYRASRYAAPYRYHNLYCGSPLHALHGNLSVSAVVEWLSYHFHLFGNKSHFVLHDAGAISHDPPMQQALEAWVKLGIVTVENVENLLHYDTFYFNQNLVLNDCLHKYKYAAERLWFFDVDEYIVIRPPHSLQSLIAHFSNVDVLKFMQLKFSDALCRPESRQDVTNKWNAERLFFRKDADVRSEQKYVLLNPRKILSTGVHDIFQTTGNTGSRSQLANNATHAAYYHYHDTIMRTRSELCTSLLPPNATTGKAPTTGLGSTRGLLYDWEYDDAILPQLAAAKSFIPAFFAANNVNFNY